MIGNYMMVEGKTIEEIKSGKLEVRKILYEDEPKEDEYLDVDKSWHAIHYLLCKEPMGGQKPYYNVVLGGTEINEQNIGFGPARYLTPQEVKETYYAIRNISEEEMRRRFNVEELQEKSIYPDFQNENEFEYVAYYFNEIKRFFERAYARGRCILLYIN